MTTKKTKRPPSEIPVSYKNANTLGLRKTPSENLDSGGGVKKSSQKGYQNSSNIVAACHKWWGSHPPKNRRQVKTESTLQELMTFLNTVYGASKRRPPPHRGSPHAEHLPSYTVLGKVEPNLSAFPADKKLRKLIPTHDGIEVQIDEVGDDAVDMFIGLDFGTSCSKVVIRDSNRRDHYAVPFFEIGADNPFLLPSHIFIDSDGRYYLDDHNVPDRALSIIRDLKLTLMQDPRNVLYMIHATAYLALVTRHARGWLLSTYRDTYKSTGITWGLNLGLPAERSEDEYLSRRFQTLALAAANLAGRPGEITQETAAQYINFATRALNDESPETLGFSIWPDMVGVYPEIAAQVIGFVESERWDADSKPFVTLIDIGAGTVDVSFFSIEKRGERRFRFFQNKVAENGVMNLHRERIGLDCFLGLLVDDLKIAAEKLAGC